jgi:hypothetical protein
LNSGGVPELCDRQPVHVQRGLQGQHCLERNKIQLVGRLHQRAMSTLNKWFPQLRV